MRHRGVVEEGGHGRLAGIFDKEVFGCAGVVVGGSCVYFSTRFERIETIQRCFLQAQGIEMMECMKNPQFFITKHPNIIRKLQTMPNIPAVRAFNFSSINP